MKVISIYELLGMVKDGKAPKKIKYENREYYLYDNKSYLSTDKTSFFDRIYFGEDYLRAELNNEVEILDKEDEFIDINGYISGVGTVDEANIEEYIHILFEQQAKLIQNQKKIIERINKEN